MRATWAGSQQRALEDRVGGMAGSSSRRTRGPEQLFPTLLPQDEGGGVWCSHVHGVPPVCCGSIALLLNASYQQVLLPRFAIMVPHPAPFP